MSAFDCDVLVIGGGISGLANAWWLAREGYSVEVWESENRTGGKIMSTQRDGYLTERAAAMVLNFRPEVADLMRESGLESDKVCRMAEAETHRYLLHHGQLKALPMRLGGMLASPLWSPLGKLRLMLEPLILTSGAKDETVGSFVRRRFGSEMLEKAMEPFVAGTLAADPEQASASATLPRLTALEKRYGSIAAGILVNRILRRRTATATEAFSFRGGMSSLVNVLAQSPNIRVRSGHSAEELIRCKHGWQATARTDSGQRCLQVRQVVVSTPAAAAASLLAPLDRELSELLQGINYAPIAVVHSGFKRGDIGHPLDGTGFLAPRREGSAFTGNLWMSSLFPGRAPSGMALLTSYLGGSRSPEVMGWSDERLLDKAIGTLTPLLGLKGAPEMVHVDRHMQALPVYHGAYQGRMQAIASQLRALPGLHLEANYIGGVSVRDRLARGRALAQRIAVANPLDSKVQSNTDSAGMFSSQRTPL